MRKQPGVLKVQLGEVEVDVELVKTHPELRVGRYVQLTVGDSGCGMDHATLARIFEPFFTTKPVGEGTGLGLAVVHGIMKSHEGCIVVSSQPGTGTTFQLFFPVFETEAIEHDTEVVTLPRGRGERILFVDDEPALSRVGKLTLERLGYSVTIATSALDALALVRDQPKQFDLVITDLTMPVMDGVRLGAELLQIRPELPIILSTGYSGVMTVAKAQELGFRELLSKPNTVQSLSEAVHRALHPEAAG